MLFLIVMRNYNQIEKYSTTASNGITITPPITTPMAREELIMQQETQYFSLLQTAAEYEISDDQLTMFNSSGTTVSSTDRPILR